MIKPTCRESSGRSNALLSYFLLITSPVTTPCSAIGDATPTHTRFSYLPPPPFAPLFTSFHRHPLSHSIHLHFLNRSMPTHLQPPNSHSTFYIFQAKMADALTKTYHRARSSGSEPTLPYIYLPA